MNQYIERVLAETKAKNANEPEFLQTVEEVLSSLEPVIAAHPEYEKAALLERMVEPERVIEFRVTWEDDNHVWHVNRGYRVQYNAALGPYKGGIRFDPSVNLSIVKFLGFEQVFKDAMTGLPIGGAKGGSDFDPRGKSDAEVMRFCQAFITELYRHIGQDIDCPAGDLGCGGREIGYMYGQYRRIVGAAEFGALSGKAVTTGGSIMRPEATGFGAVYYLVEALAHDGESIEGKRIAMSGYGNVGWGIMKKAAELGAKVTYFAGPDGYIHDPDGVSTDEKLNYILEMRAKDPMHCQPYAERFDCEFVPNTKCWGVKDVDITMAAEAGQLELNVMEPIIAFSLSNGIHRLRQAMRTLQDRCVSGITANKERCRSMVENSIGIITALNPYLGYETSASIAKEALETDGSVIDIVLARNLLSREKLDDILAPEHMINRK